MKLASVILASINTVPLSVWVFIVAPLLEVIRRGAEFGPDAMSQFFGYGFTWGALLYPIILIFNLVFFFRNYARGAYRPALVNQITTSIYLLLVLIYGLVVF